ncbi:sulfite exporter TauE/SafE family protein [Flavihumibacter fluvii]|uniref:sulfite exporter TauE/SafE family protein n=1 Tax=Flavihumibacter fluvii TaxID=2838157 RepID=UPI001BDF11E9|nr:sulfite exporter TauE/SafE family protein [Flavihumibacter fluvii]ULQ54245.1 sulfite exporter TauE/SafE family protein [Flavihumibacter fluvii]
MLKAVLGLMTSFFGFYYFRDVIRNRRKFSGKPWSGFLATGFISNFFDTLGIGSFAQQAAVFKFFKLVDDRLIPGTMNVGNTIPTVTQSFIFMTAVKVDPFTLVSMSIAAPVGALLGAGVVSRLSRRKIQAAMGAALMVVACIILAGQLKLMPVGGVAIGLYGWKLAVIILMSLVFGALQTIGVGFYAPCMAMVYALGMHPATAFPIMMTATAMLMAAGGAKFVKENAYDPKASISLTVAGVAGVFIAAYLVKSLPLDALKWVVCGVVMYTAVLMFISSRQDDLVSSTEPKIDRNEYQKDM